MFYEATSLHRLQQNTCSMNARKGLLAQSQSQSTSGHRLPVIFPSTQHGLGARSVSLPSSLEVLYREADL